MINNILYRADYIYLDRSKGSSIYDMYVNNNGNVCGICYDGMTDNNKIHFYITKNNTGKTLNHYFNNITDFIKFLDNEDYKRQKKEETIL